MLIAVEGPDGAGKQTQARRLSNRLNAELFSFPDYDNSILGPKIRHYLRGQLGTLHSNHPLLVAALYSLERAEKRSKICSLLSTGRTVVCDRYTPSNLAHQGAKLYDGKISDECAQLIVDIAAIEYVVLGLPKPDLVFYLDLTAEQSYARTHARDSDPDLHQDDLTYMRNVRGVYQYLASTEPSWRTIRCFDPDGTARSIEDIGDEMLECVSLHQRFRTRIVRPSFKLDPEQDLRKLDSPAWLARVDFS